MLRKKTLPVYSFSRRTKAGITVVVILVIAVLSFNLMLNKVKPNIEKILSKASGRNVSVQQILIYQPHKLILKGVEFSKKTKLGFEKKMLLPKTVLTFSVYKMLLERSVSVSRIEIFDPIIYDKKEIIYLNKKFRRGTNLFNTLKWQKLGVIVKNGILTEKENSNKSSTNFNLDFENELGIINVSGDILDCGINDCENKRPIEFIASAAAENDGLVFNKIDLRKEGLFFVSLNGHSNKNRLFFKGYGFSEEKSFSDDELPVEESLDSFEVLNRLFLKIGAKEFKEISAGSIHVLDINSEFSINKNTIKIERFSSLLNNIPVSMSGEIEIADSIKYDLSSIVNVFKSNNDLKGNVKDIVLQSKGYVSGGILKSDLNVVVNYGENSNIKEYIDSSGISIYEIFADLNSYPAYVFKAKNINLYSAKYAFIQEVVFNEPKIEIDLMDKDEKIINIDAELFGGKVEVKINVSKKEKKNTTRALIDFKDVDIGKIEGLSYDFSKLEGKVNSNIILTNYPKLDIRGDIDIHDGFLTNTVFLDWLSEYFDLSSVRSVEGYDVVLKFIINDKNFDIYDVNLDSKKINLDGYFKLGEYSNVSSEFRLGFDKDMMKESKRFRSLLKRIKDDRQLVAFDFRLLGGLSNINFQWMQSDFKEAATGVIPSFIKRKIEKKIEKAIK
ncbi:MAG: AsmA-like C-terminal region-containing protein [Candidatus Omnitrophica bacterium]|nr:AsmA-like C-terminal region-containing protein [Candidatus Omnitrophota bacterium]